jgi:hypothetical protein
VIESRYDRTGTARSHRLRGSGIAVYDPRYPARTLPQEFRQNQLRDESSKILLCLPHCEERAQIRRGVTDEISIGGQYPRAAARPASP